MDKDERKDFFISYTHNDQRWAEWIAWQLEDAGYTTILQAWDFLPGGNFVLDMNTATQQATRTIAVLSPDYLASKFTAPEWAAVFRHDPKGEEGLLLPIPVRPCDIEGLLGQIVYIDLLEKDEASTRTTLLQGVERRRRKPLTAPQLSECTTKGGNSCSAPIVGIAHSLRMHRAAIPVGSQVLTRPNHHPLQEGDFQGLLANVQTVGADTRLQERTNSRMTSPSYSYQYFHFWCRGRFLDSLAALKSSQEAL